MEDTRHENIIKKNWGVFFEIESHLDFSGCVTHFGKSNPASLLNLTSATQRLTIRVASQQISSCTFVCRCRDTIISLFNGVINSTRAELRCAVGQNAQVWSCLSPEYLINKIFPLLRVVWCMNCYLYLSALAVGIVYCCVCTSRCQPAFSMWSV